MLYYTNTVRQVLKELDTSENGLAITEAEERLRIYGSNTIKVKGDPLWRKLIEPFANVFMLVLFIAVVISIFHGETLDATIIGLIMVISATIYYVQRFSTERILRSLQKHNPHAVEVFRDGRATKIDASLIVPGDIIMLSEGEKIPADARIITATSLRADESQLTGESEPIDKQTDKITGEREVYERANMLFQGSFIVAGEAIAVVVATGNDTEFGQLAALTRDSNTESPVQKKIDKLLAQIIAVVASLAVVTFILATFRGMEFTESLRFVLALSVSAVPESLPVAISVVLVLGMRRMATKKALVRNMNAIETVGVITTIATDKTGTLTKNKLTVHEIWQPRGVHIDLPQLLTKAVNRNSHGMHDPLDTALSDFATLKHAKHPTQPALTNFPFDQSVAMSGTLWHNGDKYELVVKGAPEHVLIRSDLTESEHEEAETMLHKLTADGYRVIAIAHRGLTHSITTLDQLKKSEKLTFAGFVAVADILRPEAKKAVQAALRAGVTVRMITGDHFETAYHIGRELGMVTHRDQVFDSRRMSVMSDEELEKTIDSIRVFSRVIPEHKYRILSLLKKHNITAMTGDGVNDVPALANAHVGVAMGSGASIAKDAGDIILMDDNFRSIVDAMREGRTIFANIRRMLFYLLSTNAGEVITMVGALVIGIPIPLVPVQILWVNLVTDSAMVIPLGLEPGEKANMRAKPKKINAPILNIFMVSRMVLMALSMAGLVLTIYMIYSAQHGHEYGSTIAFNTLVVMQWASALCARSDSESIFIRLRVFNGKFYAGLTIAVILQLLALFGPLGTLLHVTHVNIQDLAITAVIAFLTPIILTEIHKYVGRRYFAQLVN
ncbi:MAG TPA: cation-transporting P-type ATPase [Candidatus Saccharimonadales bacterium]|nr:cation-transporting P-type ATPase [Candidatus Saccharimonadales bacterium]